MTMKTKEFKKRTIPYSLKKTYNIRKKDESQTWILHLFKLNEKLLLFQPTQPIVLSAKKLGRCFLGGWAATWMGIEAGGSATRFYASKPVLETFSRATPSSCSTCCSALTFSVTAAAAFLQPEKKQDCKGCYCPMRGLLSAGSKKR